MPDPSLEREKGYVNGLESHQMSLLNAGNNFQFKQRSTYSTVFRSRYIGFEDFVIDFITIVQEDLLCPAVKSTMRVLLVLRIYRVAHFPGLAQLELLQRDQINGVFTERIFTLLQL